MRVVRLRPILSTSIFFAFVAFPLFLAPLGCPSDDDDADVTQTPAPSTPTPDQTTPPDTSPTPPPSPSPPPAEVWGVPGEHDYYLSEPYVFSLGRNGPQGYDGLSWEGEVTFGEDTIEGYNVWYWWKSSSNPQKDPPDCSMPETFSGTVGDIPPNCDGCSVGYDITFVPMKDETTCPDTVVQFWNGEDTMWDPWDDSWGYRDIATEGWPQEYIDDEIPDFYDQYGAEFVIYNWWTGQSPSDFQPDYIGLPYCDSPDAEGCVPR